MLLQNKFTFHGLTFLIILQMQHETYRGGIGIRKERGSFHLFNNYLDDVFTLKYLIGL